MGRPGNRGPVFRIADQKLRDLRTRLGRGRELNVFVTGSASLTLADYKVFDGDRVDVAVITTDEGAERLRAKGCHDHVRLIIAGTGAIVDLAQALRVLRRDLGVRYLLCEGGPTLNGALTRARLVDERFLTISPVEFGLEIPPEQEPSAAERDHLPRYRPTTIAGPGFTHDGAEWWDWLSCRRVGSHQFNRYRARR